MNELYHYGVKGMKWGVRKSPEYSTFRSRRLRRAAKSATKDAKNLREHGYNSEAKAVLNVAKKNQQKAEAIENKRKNSKMSTAKKIAIGAAVVGGITLAGYGAYKVSKITKTRNQLRAKELVGKIVNHDKQVSEIRSNMVKDTHPNRRLSQTINTYDRKTGKRLMTSTVSRSEVAGKTNLSQYPDYRFNLGKKDRKLLKKYGREIPL